MERSEETLEALERRVCALEAENAELRGRLAIDDRGPTVSAPERFRPIFEDAERTVRAYFDSLHRYPSRGTVEISDERYVLVRAASLSVDFLSTVRSLYADRGEAEALRIGRNLLFDLAHVIGMNDAREFHRRMGLEDPVSKLAAGPVHFAHSGWAFVDILEESRPVPNEDYFLIYHHPFSFESDAWLRVGTHTDFPVCIMNAGYSSGWCEESFSVPLSAVEIKCKAKGDPTCTFIMAPPDRLPEHLRRHLATEAREVGPEHVYDIPTFFERKRSEEKLKSAMQSAEAASRAKSQFLANMSHEIRTPLSGLLGFARLLMDTALDPEQREFVETINRSGEALLTILNDVLDFSKIEAGRMRIEEVPTDIARLLVEVQSMLQPALSGREVDFEVDVAEDVPELIASDPSRLRQILLNLAGNAVKFTDRGRVRIRAAWAPGGAEQGEIAIHVEDTGVGIQEADLSRMFDEFVQLDVSNTRAHGGAGLGLAISRRLVELMGGKIAVESAPAVGTTFSIRLPSRRVDRAHMPTVESTSARSRFSGRVLLVEDNPTSRAAAAKLFERVGCEVEVAEGGHRALEMTRERSYDLILMDCQMPGLDGYETARAIRGSEAARRTPIVGFTASLLSEDAERCFEAGMDDVLPKPIDLRRLHAILERWLGVSEER